MRSINVFPNGRLLDRRRMRMTKTSRPGLGVLLSMSAVVWALAACGGGVDGGVVIAEAPPVTEVAEAAPVSVQLVELTPEDGVGTIAYDVDDEVSSLASVSAGVLVGTGSAGLSRAQCLDPTECPSGVCLGGLCQVQGLQLLSGVQFYSLPVASEVGQPVATGAIIAMAPRAGGVLVLADSGLFYTDDAQLVYSPLNEAIDGLELTNIAVSGEGDTEIVWLVGVDALYRVTEGALGEVTLPDASAPASHAAEVDGVALVALQNGTVWEVGTGDDWAARRLDADLGSVHAMVAGGGEIAAATDAGILWRDGEGAYALVDVGAPVTAMVHDGGAGGDTSGFTALTSDTMIQLAGGEVTRSVSIAEGDLDRSVTVDVRGHAWISEGAGVVGVMVGELVGFDEAGCSGTSPCRVMSDNCNVCHLDGSQAPKHDFSVYAEALALADDIVHRVSTGNMPQGFSLSDPAYEALLTWYITGQNP
jgi:hypothetical protein